MAALTSDPEVFRRVALRAAMRQTTEAGPGDDPVAAAQVLPDR